MQILLTPRLSVSLAVTVSLLLALLVYQPGIFTDPALAGVARGRGPTATGAAGLSAMHGPLRATRGRDPATSLSAGHEPLRAACGHGHAVAAGLRWTCGLDSSIGDQRQEEVVKSKLGNLHLRLSPTE